MNFKKSFLAILGSIAFILLIGGGIITISRIDQEPNMRKLNQEKQKVTILEDAYEVVPIDGCEYIRSRTWGGFFVHCHKGNCTNSIHIYNQPNK